MARDAQKWFAKCDHSSKGSPAHVLSAPSGRGVASAITGVETDPRLGMRPIHDAYKSPPHSLGDPPRASRHPEP